MKINKLVIENFMKLSSLSVDIEGRNVTFTGKNEKGKSTAINTIWFALTGEKIPKEPIKQGQTSAKLVVEVKRDDGSIIIVTRKFKKDGNGSLTVTTPEGASFKSPQTFLNVLIGEISFDPFDFINKQPREQKKYLQEVLKIDTTDIDQRKTIALAEKKAQEDKLTTKESELREYDDLPKEPLTKREVAEIDKLQTEQNERQERLTKAIRDGNESLMQVEKRTKEVSEIGTRIETLEKQLVELKLYHEAITSSLENETKANEVAQKNTEKIQAEVSQFANVPDQIKTLLKEIEDHNKKVERQVKRTETETAIESVRVQITNSKDKLTKIEDERVALISSVQMPIPGLDFSEDGISFEGLPFSKAQFSTAKMNMIGFQIAVALNPKLKILRVKDWVLLDSETKQQVKDLAEKNEYQVFYEQVTDDQEIGFVIEEK